MQLAVTESGKQIGNITASFGIAELGPGDDADALIQRADAQALRGQVRRQQPRRRGPRRRRVRAWARPRLRV